MNKKKAMIAAAISATLASASLSCCTNKPHDERSEGRVRDDKKITKTVEKRLNDEPVYKFKSVGVKTYGGIVQLSGFVNIPDEKRRAEDIARHVPGVSQVMNALIIKPAPPFAPTGQPTGERLTPPARSSTEAPPPK